MSEPKLTKAQLAFLALHKSMGVSGFLSRYNAHKTYAFVRRVKNLGLVEIVESGRHGLSWSYWWEGTCLTDLGRAALSHMEVKR